MVSFRAIMVCLVHLGYKVLRYVFLFLFYHLYPLTLLHDVSSGLFKSAAGNNLMMLHKAHKLLKQKGHNSTPLINNSDVLCTRGLFRGQPARPY